MPSLPSSTVTESGKQMQGRAANSGGPPFLFSSLQRPRLVRRQTGFHSPDSARGGDRYTSRS